MSANLARTKQQPQEAEYDEIVKEAGTTDAPIPNPSDVADGQTAAALDIANAAVREWNAARRTEAAISRATGSAQSAQASAFLVADKMSDEILVAISNYLNSSPLVVRRLVITKLKHRIKSGTL